MTGTQPYVSVAFVNRNDGYGGDLEERINKFIAYYGHYVQRWPGLFEFVIVDWNPPSDRPTLARGFEWLPLGNVTHVEVPPDIHAAVAASRGRKMLDYFGRNVAIRHGRGKFSLVLNQDIFISQSILEVIAKRRLSADHFYRADRSDFDFGPCRNTSIPDFEACARSQTFVVHRRHRSSGEPISVQATASTLEQIGSDAESGDRVDITTNVIDCIASADEKKRNMRQLRQWRWMPWRRKNLANWRNDYLADTYYRRFHLHTNGAGDFLLAPRKAFDAIHGFLESLDTYMHTDSYALVQLFCAGYKQAIFAAPHRVYHADHDRSARAGFVEAHEWAEHERRFSEMMRGERDYRLNQSTWGLEDRKLPTDREGISLTHRHE